MFDILSRAMKETEGVHCPICRRSFQNFMKIPLHTGRILVCSDSTTTQPEIVYLLGCFECGCVFVPKDLRDDERAKVKSKAEAKIAKKKAEDLAAKEIEALVHNNKVDAVIESTGMGFFCQYCGKPSKNKSGRYLHEKACKQNPSNQ